MWGYGPQSGMMDWGYGYGYGAFHTVFGILVLIAIIAGIVWLVRSIGPTGAQGTTHYRSDGLDVLDERYARGEINRDEYLQKRADVLG